MGSFHDDSFVRLKLLLVDDVEFQIEMIVERLEELGHNIVTETSPINALKLLQEQDEFDPFDLVITDLKMPKLNGIELIKKIKKFNKKIKIAVLTIEEQKKDEVLKQVKVDGFVGKTENTEKLKYFISSILEEKKSLSNGND